MASSFWRSAFRRGGHVVAYGLTVIVGYLAAGQVLSYFYGRAAPDRELGSNPMVAFFKVVVQGGFMVLSGLIAAVFVFVGIVGVGGAILSQAWSRLVPIILDRRSTPPQGSA